MWKNTDAFNSNSSNNDNFTNVTDTNKIQTSSLCQQDSIQFNEGIKTNIAEIGTQAVGIQSDYGMPEYHKRKLEYIDPTTDTRSKRGRGRGSRGSYRPRGRARFVGSSVSSSYGANNSMPRVCVNPEILKILGYSNQNCSDYYYQNNNRVTNNYGYQVLVDQSGMPQNMIGRAGGDMHQQITDNPNYMMVDQNNRELLKQNEMHLNSQAMYESNVDNLYRNGNDDKIYYYQYENCSNSSDNQEFISEDKLNNNFTELATTIRNQSNYVLSHDNACSNNIEIINDGKILTDQEKSILDISRPNQHHLVEWETYKRPLNNNNNMIYSNYDSYVNETTKFMNEIEILFQNENQYALNNGQNLSSVNSNDIQDSQNSYQQSMYHKDNRTEVGLNGENVELHGDQYEDKDLSITFDSNSMIARNQKNYDSVIEQNRSLPPVSTVLHDNGNSHLIDQNSEIENAYSNNDTYQGPPISHRLQNKSETNISKNEFEILDKYCNQKMREKCESSSLEGSRDESATLDK